MAGNRWAGKQICTIVACGRFREARGLCSVHYQQARLGVAPWTRECPRDAENTVVVDGDSLGIVLTDRRGVETARAWIDADDWPLLRHVRWAADARRHTTYVSGTERSSRRSVRLHALLFPDADEVDHFDGDGLNNRRSNLRPCTRVEQMQNIAHVGRERLRGVCFNPRGGSVARPWVAMCQSRGVRHWIGHFATEDEAREAVSSFRSVHVLETNEARHR